MRSVLYTLAKLLGDAQAVSKAISKKSPNPVLKRVGRRLYGKLASPGLNLFK